MTDYIHKKKIIFILGSLEIGGVEKVTANLANNLSNKNYDITIICLENRTATIEKWFDKKIKIIKLNLKISYYHYIITLIRCFREIKPDIIISGKEHINICCFIARFLSIPKAKHFLTIHGNLSLLLKYEKNISLKLILLFGKIFYRFLPFIVTVSNSNKKAIKKILKLPDHKIKVIYNPVIEKQKLNITPPKPHYWFEEEIPIIISCGRLAYEKNHILLVEAFKKAQEKMKLRLMILGDGPLKQEIILKIQELKIEENVLLLGNINNPIDYMYYANLFVLTSKYEGLPTVLIEALAAGCEIISVQCSDAPSEILENGKYGVVIPNNDSDRLANEMINHFNKTPLPKQFLQQRALDFEIDKIANEYIKLFS